VQLQPARVPSHALSGSNQIIARTAPSFSYQLAGAYPENVAAPEEALAHSGGADSLRRAHNAYGWTDSLVGAALLMTRPRALLILLSLAAVSF